MKKVFKLTGSFFRTLPSGEEKFYEHGAEIDDLTEAEITSLGNKLTRIEVRVKPGDVRSGIDPEAEEEDVEPEPVEEITPDEPADGEDDPEAEDGEDGDDESEEDDEDEGEDDPESEESDKDDSDEPDPDDAEDESEDDDESDEVDVPESASHVGGGWYLLPNGEKVQGKENIPDKWR
jgi:hypothetical protein